MSVSMPVIGYHVAYKIIQKRESDGESESKCEQSESENDCRTGN